MVRNLCVCCVCACVCARAAARVMLCARSSACVCNAAMVRLRFRPMCLSAAVRCALNELICKFFLGGVSFRPVDHGRDEAQHLDGGAQGEDGRIAGKRRKHGGGEDGLKKKEKLEDSAGKVGLHDVLSNYSNNNPEAA